VSQMLQAAFVSADASGPGKFTSSFVMAGVLLLVAAALTFTLRKPARSA